MIFLIHSCYWYIQGDRNAMTNHYRCLLKLLPECFFFLATTTSKGCNILGYDIMNTVDSPTQKRQMNWPYNLHSMLRNFQCKSETTANRLR